MRKFIARLIVAIVNLMVSPMRSIRRRHVKAMVSERLSTPFRIHTRRGRLLIAQDSRNCVHQATGFHNNESDTLQWIDGMPADSCLWDIGANIGIFSLYAGLGPKVRVLSFEPSGSSYATLNRNIELNDLSHRISAYCIAFSDRTQLDFLNMASTTSGGSMHGFGTVTNQFDRVIDVQFRQAALGFSIDDFVERFSPPLPTHIKLDVDGIEASILQGGRNTLSMLSVQSMIVEIEGDLSSERNRQILSIMSDLGFSAQPKTSPDLRNVIFRRWKV